MLLNHNTKWIFFDFYFFSNCHVFLIVPNYHCLVANLKRAFFN